MKCAYGFGGGFPAYWALRTACRAALRSFSKGAVGKGKAREGGFPGQAGQRDGAGLFKDAGRGVDPAVFADGGQVHVDAPVDTGTDKRSRIAFSAASPVQAGGRGMVEQVEHGLGRDGSPGRSGGSSRPGWGRMVRMFPLAWGFGPKTGALGAFAARISRTVPSSHLPKGPSTLRKHMGEALGLEKRAALVVGGCPPAGRWGRILRKRRLLYKVHGGAEIPRPFCRASSSG